MSAKTKYFTSESVTEGHPDKICDQISDAVVDAIIAKEIELEKEGYISPTGVAANPSAVRVACETMVTTGLVLVAGEIRTEAYIDVDCIARDVIRNIGYTRAKYGFDADTCSVLNAVHGQSPDIARGVDAATDAKGTDPLDQLGAGDQGMMFGYACDETPHYMPMPIYLAHKLTRRLSNVRKDGTLSYLRPDGKSQVSIRYEGGRPVAVDKVLVSTQHSEDVDYESLKRDITKYVIDPVLEEEYLDCSNSDILINPTGRFVVGGPMGDCGLTGRKIIVDTYGGMGRHGGGAFSGKDCTKVDRSGAYAARWVAKNICAANLAHRCEVQIAYAIGRAKPFSVSINAFNTEHVDIAAIEKAVNEVFDLRPQAIINDLNLLRPIYLKTASYGHFGRSQFPWEQTNRVRDLQRAVNIHAI